MIKVGWGNTKQNYLIWQFQEDWQMSDYHRAFDKTAELLMSRKDIPIMVDMRNIGSANLLVMAHDSLRYKIFLTNRVIFVGSLSFMLPIYAILSHILSQKRIKVSLVETIDEAYKMIMEENHQPIHRHNVSRKQEQTGV